MQYRNTLELDPEFVPAHFFLALTYVQKARFDDAISEFRKALSCFGGTTLHTAAEGYAHAMAGNRGEAHRILGVLEKYTGKRYVPLYYMAAIHTGLGDADRAFEWLDVHPKISNGVLPMKRSGLCNRET